ncbi:hypothetical protein DICSQDRAFT_148961 [Dichomitus squalens LYAD-421 SS1]|uniref:Uncharacterized protein n=1 Tax=Dichomitus squalens (strain LYAD-421) TaxID=732165 RepID=R7SQW8_DICSQ|nr:uncharacterized protein DICSQDRAFT_148961 [Dichomitus squalens LYAD-421 SS1]EJF58579.1 hypothetical protein DICSQDRAFT_148961 [Dichomitus squalens LYAD-421 SS1]
MGQQTDTAAFSQHLIYPASDLLDNLAAYYPPFSSSSARSKSLFSPHPVNPSVSLSPRPLAPSSNSCCPSIYNHPLCSRTNSSTSCLLLTQPTPSAQSTPTTLTSIPSLIPISTRPISISPSAPTSPAADRSSLTSTVFSSTSRNSTSSPSLPTPVPSTPAPYTHNPGLPPPPLTPPTS